MEKNKINTNIILASFAIVFAIGIVALMYFNSKSKNSVGNVHSVEKPLPIINQSMLNSVINEKITLPPVSNQIEQKINEFIDIESNRNWKKIYNLPKEKCIVAKLIHGIDFDTEVKYIFLEFYIFDGEKESEKNVEDNENILEKPACSPDLIQEDPPFNNFTLEFKANTDKIDALLEKIDDCIAYLANETNQQASLNATDQKDAENIKKILEILKQKIKLLLEKKPEIEENDTSGEKQIDVRMLLCSFGYKFAKMVIKDEIINCNNDEEPNRSIINGIHFDVDEQDDSQSLRKILVYFFINIYEFCINDKKS
ncbi:hypothetical protein EDEG_01898 [Edhazardia aedis USNM 41457]|uniref:Uncharacterized protein n=1 Tax=Edhazardia aedis (strain USNM 41457) TaxID=1003232 RepID=J9D7N3_EDHAE|nr:hypothetical protein EDEG_01898 [Edhazardia aedis USNM 41457]|eukprot:EJW03806.1 hypothetical protein EDEG_01898 [Edhazardia aedis USNM 41457]